MAEFLFLAGLPLVVGLMEGAVAPRRERLNAVAIAVAPVASCFVMCVVLLAWDVHYRYTHPNPDRPNPTPVVVQSLFATLAYSPGIFLAGAIPAITGSAFVQWLKAVPKP